MTPTFTSPASTVFCFTNQQVFIKHPLYAECYDSYWRFEDKNEIVLAFKEGLLHYILPTSEASSPTAHWTSTEPDTNLKFRLFKAKSILFPQIFLLS